MQQLNRNLSSVKRYPTKIIQFGEGNFLRAFVDWQLDLLNEQTDLNSGIAVIRPIDTNFPPSLNTQDGLYTCLIRGLDQNGEAVSEKRIISSINQELSAYKEFDAVLELARNPEIRFVFSNTTEAGIAFDNKDKLADAPPSSFPGKLTRMLWERYQEFDGDHSKGVVIIPCELIDYNGKALKQVINQYIELWGLPDAFRIWANSANTFCSTLVDRIVTGYPKDEIETLEAEFNYKDTFVVSAESFYLFVIQGPEWLKEELCLNQLSSANQLNIRIVDDIKPYKDRKVAILNGAHTALVPVAYQAGLDIVGESMQDKQISAYLKQVMFDEIIPTLSLPEDELKTFAHDVENRFKNPYIKHLLLSISLNGMTKFKTRILPQLQEYSKQNSTPPELLTFSLAALITFYRGVRGNESYPLADTKVFLDLYKAEWEKVESGETTIARLVEHILSDSEHWGSDLTLIPDLSEMVTVFAEEIVDGGMRQALANRLKEPM